MAYSANLTAHDPTKYAHNASFVYNDANTAPVLSLLNAQQGERILDVGCGNGSLTDKLVDLVGENKGEVWGMDANQRMLDAAAGKYPRLAQRLLQADAQGLEELPYNLQPHSFDAVFSNATLHWCKRSPRGVIQSVKGLLKENGKSRFVGEFGGFMNCVGVRNQLAQVLKENGEDPNERDPWYFPTCEKYRELLESEGFTVQHISLNPRLTPLDTDLHGWLLTFARDSWLAGMGDEEAERILREVVKRCEVDHRHSDKVGQPMEDSKGQWAVMYVRLRFCAVLMT